MNQYITGSLIKELREKNHLTQLELAEKLHVSDKTISKWETGKGYPDITLLEPIASVFNISLTELFSGTQITNSNASANMMRSRFFICPICGNIIHSMGELSLSCHGITLYPQTAELFDEKHSISLEIIEDEYFVQINHEMSKSHYISFIAAVSFDNIKLIKLYPESNPECRLPIRGVQRIVFYCNQDGLFYMDVKKLSK